MNTINGLVASLEDGLTKIQNMFDEFQKKNFPGRTPEFFCLELNGEAGELANAEKKRWKGKDIAHHIFEDEAADVFIALMNYSNSRKIDLAKSVREKLQKIENERKKLAEKGLSY